MNSITILLLLFIFVFSLINKSSKESIILVVAFVLRVAVLILDYYHLVHIPFAGGDTEFFHAFALRNLAGHQIHYTHYTDFLVSVYSLTGSSRFFAQGINVAFSYCTLLVVSGTTKLIGLSRKQQLFALALVAFMPSMVAFSGILLREAWIEFFLTLSVYFFVKWYKQGGLPYIGFCFLSAFIAAYMHDGTIGALVGYGIAFVFYSRVRNRESIRSESILALLVLLLIGLLVIQNLGSLASKFATIAEKDLLESEINKNNGGSAYLQWMAGYSFQVALLLSPIRMFYLLFSPIPFDWRGFMDIAVFFVDSIVYVILLWNICRRFKLASHLRKYLLISFLSMTLLFSMGTSNSGTAIRHRAKFYPFLVLTYCVAIKDRTDNENKMRIRALSMAKNESKNN